ncbi:MAG: BREX-1 system adenine-specific DNA-methyltransferase PglX [Planctomycetaceae bacterium]
METGKLKKFAQFTRNALREQVASRLDLVLAKSSLARRESEDAVKELEEQIKLRGRDEVVERVAYTWFNRFCALRYMDVNRVTRLGVVSPTEGFSQPEILMEAKQGTIDDDLKVDRKLVMELLDGSRPSSDPQQEAYRILLVAVCNSYHDVMPFMFEKIADYTELLLPHDLLSGNSVLTYTREVLVPANCSPEFTDQSVEVIGWLYQFYISEKKDEVFDALKKGKKITPENIPAATQLFTPHWIVRYLVENSVGRLWMLNHPVSRLAEQMDYYIKPEEPETDFLRISSPEEIKICDPACGSGHMLTYAFDLLYAIYEEQGYQATDIPRLILTHNLYGIEIDQRAGALAAFALTMKAREK